MTTKYSEEFKASIIAKLLPPHNVTVPDLVKETGIPKDTLYTWRAKYRNAQSESGSSRNQQANKFNNEEKLTIVIETAISQSQPGNKLSEAERTEILATANQAKFANLQS